MMRLRLSMGIVLSISLMAACAFAQDGPGDDYEILPKSPEVSGPRVELIANFLVNNSGDDADATPGDNICETATGNGICTLRAAVLEANAVLNDDTISFAAGIASIDVNGQIVISDNLTINGPGATLLTIRNVATASTTSRVFDITAGDTVTISGVTIANGGVTTGDGGGIRNAGILTVTKCIVTNNLNTGTSNNGGGIRSGAGSALTVTYSVISSNRSANSGGLSFAGTNLTVSDSVIRDNTATNGNGGGANVAATSAATITRTTISGNSALNSSGGMFMTRGNVLRSTISGNSANGSGTNGGGGLRVQAGVNTASLGWVTVTNNTAPNAASGARSGVWHETGTLNISASIIANNVTQDFQRDGTAVTGNLGHNLIGENTSVTTEFPDGLPNGTNWVGTDAMPLDPLLGPLAFNGGFSFTHMPLEGSVAIDRGLAEEKSDVDQRNYFRPVDLPGVPNAPSGDGCDIGAVEASSGSAFPVSVAGRVTTAEGAPIGKAVVTITDAGGNSRVALTSPFGHYRIQSLDFGAVYVVSVVRKGASFTPKTIIPTDTVVTLDFTPDP